MKKLLLIVGLALAFAPLTAQTTLPLVQSSEMAYVGAFRMPTGAPTDAESFNYGGTALAYYAAHDSLFAVGFNPLQYAAELHIPEIRNVGSVNSLAEATYLQALTDPLHGQRNTVDGDTGNGVKIGGIFPYGTDLIVNAFTYYDGGGTQSLSHFKVASDFSQTTVTGPVKVSNSLGQAGFVFAYMLSIPSAWQSLFGGPAFTGGCCKAIIGRTSLGPSLTVFNPANVGTTSPVPGTTVLGYPITHPTLGIYEGGTLYNGGVSIAGAVFPEGTRSVLFFGRNATTNNYCYGAGTTNQALDRQPDPDLPGVVYCYDKYDQSKGPHNYPYSSFVWAYDANDLLLVKNGTKQPWEIVPYATWGFTTPFMTEVGYNAGHTVQGVTYKASTQQIFLTEEGQDGTAGPIVHVFHITTAGGTVADTTPPTVSLTAPAAGTVSGSVTVSASAADNVGVVGVQFKRGGLNLGAEDTTAPYSVTWDTTASANASHVLSAVARDAAGNTTTSGTVTVTVSNTVADTTVPTVAMSAPAAGSVSGSITVSATASDNIAVAGVQFKLDGALLGAEDTSSPYTLTWDTRSVPDGSHVLKATARDTSNNVATSSTVTVTVANSIPDTTNPAVSITAPTDAATVSGTQSVTATATDDVAVAGVQFKLDGALLGAEDTTAPYAVSWNTLTSTNASHTIKATARDSSGNVATSSTITVTVSNATADTTPPTVSISAPSNGATVSGTTVTITASASDDVAVSGVQFLLAGVVLQAEDTSAPYSITWDSTSVANGNYAITAVARDAAANTTTSSAITVTVNNVSDVTAPVTAITSPTTGATVSGSINVAATASDNAAVAGVTFLLDGVAAWTEDTLSPYSVVWNTTTASAGSHTLQTRARDLTGNVGTSALVTVTVDNSSLPTFAINVTRNVQTCQFVMTATPPDNSGGWTVQFRTGTTPLASKDNTSPYSRTITVNAGIYRISAYWTKSGRTPVSSAVVLAQCQ